LNSSQSQATASQLHSELKRLAAQVMTYHLDDLKLRLESLAEVAGNLKDSLADSDDYLIAPDAEDRGACEGVAI
jgi:hypothetical protein